MSRTLSLEGLNVIPALLELQMQPEQDENHENLVRVPTGGTIVTNGLGRATPAEAVPLFPALGLTG